MSLGQCLSGLHAGKLISDASYERLRPQYEELVGQFEQRYGRAAAESMATEKVLELHDFDVQYRKRQALLQAERQGAWVARMRQVEGGAKAKRVAGEQFFVDLDGHRRAVRQQALSMNAELAGQMRKTLLGQIRDPAQMRDVLDEIFGSDTGNAAAKAMADSWRQTAEMLRSRFNSAGGHIARLDNWNLPQVHDMRLVRDAGFDTWRDFVVPLLDRKAMIDHATGLPINGQKLEGLLRGVWESVRTDGWNKNNPGQMFAGAKANQRASHRVLHFADARSWEAYAERFGGGGTAFDAMMAHVEGMTRDIASMEKMGPNPTATLRFMQDWMAQDSHTGGLTGRAAEQANDEMGAAGGGMQRLFDEYTGANNRPERRRVALGFSMFRAQQSAAKLGGAALSVGGDFGMMFHTAGFNGLSGAKVMARYVSMMNPANTADRAQAARHVLISDQWVDSHSGQYRVLGEELASEGARLVATGVLRASGLIAHTDVARQAFGMEMTSFVTSMRERSFGQLDPAFQRLLLRYDIGEARWDVMRRVQPDSDRGTDWLYPETIGKAGDQALADDYMRMIVTEADFAVPSPDIRTRAAINSHLKKGTWPGEIVRSAFLFKGFPLTVINMHGRRMLEQGMSRGEVAGFVAKALVMRYGLSLMAMTTIGGAVSLQLKEVARGRDPMPMDNGKFWTAALLQGGGLGIVGDFLFAGENRFGGGVADTAAGPIAQTIDTALEVGKTPFRLLDNDEANDDHWKRAASKLVMSEVPGMSYWPTRLLVERTLGDLMTEWAYGDTYDERVKRIEQYAAERGTQYYAEPGSGELRAPNLSNALGNPTTAEADPDAPLPLP